MPTDIEVERRMLIGLASGRQLIASGVMLFPQHEVQQVLLLKAKAQEELVGFSTALGYWGASGWMIGGAAAIGFVDSLLPNSKMKKGLEFLKEAAIRHEQNKSKGVFFDVPSIDGIDRPNPAAWRATQVSQFQIDLHPMDLLEKGRVIQRYGISRDQVRDGIATVTGPIRYVYDEDEFVWIEIKGQATAVRWSAVECYQLGRIAPPA